IATLLDALTTYDKHDLLEVDLGAEEVGDLLRPLVEERGVPLREELDRVSSLRELLPVVCARVPGDTGPDRGRQGERESLTLAVELVGKACDQGVKVGFSGWRQAFI